MAIKIWREIILMYILRNWNDLCLKITSRNHRQNNRRNKMERLFEQIQSANPIFKGWLPLTKALEQKGGRSVSDQRESKVPLKIFNINGSTWYGPLVKTLGTTGGTKPRLNPPSPRSKKRNVFKIRLIDAFRQCLDTA